MEAFDRFLQQVDDYRELAERVVGELVAERKSFEQAIAEVAQQIPAEKPPPEELGKNAQTAKRLLYYAEGIVNEKPDITIKTMLIQTIRAFLQQNPSPDDGDPTWQKILDLKDDLRFKYMRLNGGIGQIFLKLKPKGPNEVDRVTVDYTDKEKPPIIQVIGGHKFESKFTKIFQQTSRDAVAVKEFNDDFCETILQRNLTSIDLGKTTAVLLSYGQSGSGKTYSNELLYEAIAKHVELSQNKLMGTRAFQFYNDCIRSQDVNPAASGYQQLTVHGKHTQRDAALIQGKNRTIPLTAKIGANNTEMTMVEPPLPLLLFQKKDTSKKLENMNYYPFNVSTQLDAKISSISYNETIYKSFISSGGNPNPEQIPKLNVRLTKNGDEYVQDSTNARVRIQSSQILGTPDQLSHLFFGGDALDRYFHRFYGTRIYDMHLFPDGTPELKIKESEMEHLIPYQQFRNQTQRKAVGLDNGSNFATFDHSELMYPMFKPTTERAISNAYKLQEDQVEINAVPELNAGETVGYLKQLIDKFGKHRFTRSMKSNNESSRSQLVVELHFTNGSKLVIMDLAGNESVLTSSKPTQISFYEGMYINQTLDFVRDLAVAIMSQTPFKENTDAFARYLSTLVKATLTILVCAFESSPKGIEGVVDASDKAFEFIELLDGSLPEGAKLTGEVKAKGGNRRRTYARKLNKHLSYVKHKRVFRKNKTVYKKPRTRKNKLR